jgi:hypothetical protein
MVVMLMLRRRPAKRAVHLGELLKEESSFFQAGQAIGVRDVDLPQLVESDARRKFTDALKARKKPGGPPLQALNFFERLYRVESLVEEEKPAEGETRTDYISRLRHKHSVPVLDALKKWLDDIAPKVLPDTKLGDAVSYTLNQWEYLTRYAKDGRMPIDNNVLERDIRPFVTGRKSWLFSDTVAGARASAVVYSLVLTCRACGVEPFAWLRHALTELPKRDHDANIDDLLPFNFPKPQPDQDVKSSA